MVYFLPLSPAIDIDMSNYPTLSDVRLKPHQQKERSQTKNLLTEEMFGNNIISLWSIPYIG